MKYRVTEKAGQFVAGKRVKLGDVPVLSPKAAEYEVQRGVLEPVAADAPATPASETPPLNTPQVNTRSAYETKPKTIRGYKGGDD